VVLENNGARKRFVENAQKTLAGFTPEKMVKRYEDVFLDVVQGHGHICGKTLQEDSVRL
jgi:hypothetical protein